MTEQPADPLEKLWRAGVPLSKAWLAYAQPDLKAEWTALEGKSALTALTTSVKRRVHPEPIAASTGHFAGAPERHEGAAKQHSGIP
jgi:hypothetical protein